MNNTMKPTNELRLEIAKYLYELWKIDARSLQIGGHLDKAKAKQYEKLITKWELLDPMYQINFLENVDEILKICVCNMDTLAHICFNENEE